MRSLSLTSVVPLVHLSVIEHDNLLDEIDCVRTIEDWCVKRSSVLLAHVHEISLVLCLSLQLFTLLREFVIGNKESLSLNLLLVKVWSGWSSTFRLLKANKCSWSIVAISCLNDLDTFNLTKRLKNYFEICLSKSARESLDKKIALLLRILESLLFTKDLSMSLVLRKSRLDIKLESIDFLIMEIIYSILSTFWAITSITFSFIAYESKWFLNAIFACPLLYVCRFDVTIVRENTKELLFSPRWIEILDIDVIYDITYFTGISRIEFNRFTYTSNFTFFHCFFGWYWVLEANKAISIWNWWRWAVLNFYLPSIFNFYYDWCRLRDFCAFDLSNILALFLKFLRSQISVEVLNEHIHSFISGVLVLA